MQYTRFTLVIASLALLGACGTDTPETDPTSGTGSSAAAASSAVSSASSSVTVSSAAPASQPASSAPAPSGEARVITITADNWSFSPATITVRKGENVQLKIVSKAGVHGFAVPSLGINTAVTAGGDAVTVTLPTGKAGIYDAFCSIPCGAGHRDMKATIVIEE